MVRSVETVFSKRGPKIGTMTGVQVRRPARVLGRWSLLLVLASLALEVGGCNGWFRPVEWGTLGPRNKEQQASPFRVVPRKSAQVATLSPDDIVRIMQRVGFADEQIMELGTDLHNALRFSGMADVFYRKDKLAIFMADGDYVRIRSRSGEFNYQISKGQFDAPPQRNW
jgi:hypothetical protein